MRLARVLIVVCGLASTATAQPTLRSFDAVPPSQARAASGLVFSPAGGDFVLTNVEVTGPTITVLDPYHAGTPQLPGPLYLSLGVAGGRPDAQGVIHYQADPTRFKVWVVQALPKTPVRVLKSGQFQVGGATLRSLGGTSYVFSGHIDLDGTYNPTVVSIAFDTSLPPGRQVTSGKLYELLLN